MLERIKADIGSDQEQKAIIEAEIKKIELEIYPDGEFYNDEGSSSSIFSSVVFEQDQHTIELNITKGLESAEFDF
jgi:hypothetical protein